MTAKFSLVGVATLCVMPIVLSCGGDDGMVHTITHVDAEIDAPEPCKAADSYTPTLGSDQHAEDYPATGSGDTATLHQEYYSGAINAEDPADYLYIDLYADYGAFTGSDIGSGTFSLTGDDAAYSSCGACVTIAADATDTFVDDWYMASGGIMTLTSVTTRITGTLSNVTLRRVITDPEGGPSDALQGDCTTHITSASFDAPLTLGSANGRVVTTVPVHAPLHVLRHRKQ